MAFNQPYYGYQGQPLNMNYNTYTPMQQYIPQQFMPQNQPRTQDNTIPCEYVDNLEVVNAKNCDFTGKPMLYMKTDGTEIYRKQLDIKTGKSTTYLYKLQEDINGKLTNNALDLDGLNSQIESLRNEFSHSITDLKQIVMNISSGTQGIEPMARSMKGDLQ